MEDFGNPGLKHRLMPGGLPPFFLSGELPERDFKEWLDAYWGRDIQELFRLERRVSFQRFVELLLTQSGLEVRFLTLDRLVERLIGKGASSKP
jgi:uncharacterized protein